MKKILGIPILLFVLGLLVIGASSAALLLFYGKIVTTVNVQQSILLDGENYLTIQEDLIPEESPGGEMFCFKHTLENRMSVEGTVEFYDDCFGIDLEEEPINCDGVTTTIYSLPETTILTLENKDGSWNVIIDDTQATLAFKTVNPTFIWALTATGLQSDILYSLIYYADKEDPFVNWGGNNPGAFIAEALSNGTGGIDTTGEKDVGMNIPSQPDINFGSGGKIWLVPSAALPVGYPSDDPWQYWQASGILFETELVTYYDCDEPVEPNFPVETSGIVVDNSLTIPSKTTQDFLTCYGFVKNIASGTYNITTTIVP